MLASHDRFTYSPITERPDFTWPGGRRLAIHLSLNLEHFAYNEGLGLSYSPGIPHPNTYNWAWREYGNRVGVWRLIELCDALKLPMSVLLNSEVYEHCPRVVDALRKRGDEILGHGRTNSEHQNNFDEAGEKKLIDDVSKAITEYEGKAPKGRLSPGVNPASVPVIVRRSAETAKVPAGVGPAIERAPAASLMAISWPKKLPSTFASTPKLPLLESRITLPALACIRLADALRMSTPSCPFPSAPVPAALVPISFSLMTLEFEALIAMPLRALPEITFCPAPGPPRVFWPAPEIRIPLPPFASAAVPAWLVPM